MNYFDPVLFLKIVLSFLCLIISLITTPTTKMQKEVRKEESRRSSFTLQQKNMNGKRHKKRAREENLIKRKKELNPFQNFPAYHNSIHTTTLIWKLPCYYLCLRTAAKK